MSKASRPSSAVEAKSSKAQKAPKVKAPKIKRVFYPGLQINTLPNEKGKVIPFATVKFDSLPADFDPRLHRPFRRLDFTTDGPFLIARAEALEARIELVLQRVEKAKAKAVKLREEAATAFKTGSREDQAMAKKLIKILGVAEALKAQLAAQGIEFKIPTQVG